MRKLLAELI